MAPEKYWDRFDVSNVKHHTKRATFSLKKKKKACPFLWFMQGRKSYECGNDDWIFSFD